LDNRLDGADTRLAAIAGLFDPVTFRQFGATGVTRGWHCWEIGAGGPTVSAWLARAVGPTGEVVATDLDLSRFGEPPDGVTALVHDVTTDPPPGEAFDLIHARLVLVHIPARTSVIATLAGALRPGGWLVVEDADPALQPLACVDERGPDEVLANRIRAGFRVLLAERGADLAFGRTLPRLLRDSGMVDVSADAWFPVAGRDGAVVEQLTVEQVGAGLVSRGLATGNEVERHLENLAAGRLDVATAPLVSTRGRRPGPPATAAGRPSPGVTTDRRPA
jgi:SAM-dependent methyltransferase